MNNGYTIKKEKNTVIKSYMLAYTWTFHEIFMKNAYECCIKNKSEEIEEI